MHVLEQDAHELFHVFTETLQDEVTQFPAVVPLFDVASILVSELEAESSHLA